VSWPRVIPKGCATCPINAKGLKFYVDLVKELIANGIEPAVTL
jgi:beta-glucosidase